MQKHKIKTHQDFTNLHAAFINLGRVLAEELKLPELMKYLSAQLEKHKIKNRE